MTIFRLTTLSLLTCSLLATAIGCQRNNSQFDSQQLSEARDRYVLTSEPDGVESVLDVQETLESPREVVLVGRVGGVKQPWTKGKATFVLADPVVLAESADESDEHICTDDGCKFCARKNAEKMKEGIAIVQFLDDDGDILPIDARQLFDLGEEQTLIVRGRAEIGPLGCLVVAANGLYVRR